MVSMAGKSRRSWVRRLARWRPWVQAGFLLAWLDPLLLRMHTVCSPVFHCYSCPLATFACPIGVLANFSALHVVPYLAIGTLLAVGVLLGSFICGWVCPFGYLQDLMAKVPAPKFRLPAWTGNFRYVMLIGLVLAVPYFFGEGHPLFFCRVCPAAAIEAAVPYTISTAVAGSGIAWPSITKSVILVVFLGAALFIWRPWCTLFCPLGAIYGVMNRVSFVFLGYQPAKCNDCDLCRDLCNYRASGHRRGDEVRCIRCLECVRCNAITLQTVFVPSSELEANAPAEETAPS
jgi:polyferredoxin